MGRNLRRVPADWQHLKKDNGNYQPMYEKYYGDALNEWLNEHNMWLDGTHPDLIEHPEYKTEYPFYAMYGGDAPEVAYYQSRKYAESELTHIQLYEDTTEGTPVSPVFKADELDKLCEYAAAHCTTFGSAKATKEQWFKMLSGGFVHHTEGNITFM